ncbi:hypothetical protein [Hydrogenimonas sp. SS33]|uniref:hypothetical protein n=1 Tax=Hydrogenimonas leucolamina TaxID=2954236 RepID=UPI00336BFABA
MEVGSTELRSDNISKGNAKVILERPLAYVDRLSYSLINKKEGIDIDFTINLKNAEGKYGPEDFKLELMQVIHGYHDLETGKWKSEKLLKEAIDINHQSDRLDYRYTIADKAGIYTFVFKTIDRLDKESEKRVVIQILHPELLKTDGIQVLTNLSNYRYCEPIQVQIEVENAIDFRWQFESYPPFFVMETNGARNSQASFVPGLNVPTEQNILYRACVDLSIPETAYKHLCKNINLPPAVLDWNDLFTLKIDEISFYPDNNITRFVIENNQSDKLYCIHNLVPQNKKLYIGVDGQSIVLNSKSSRTIQKVAWPGLPSGKHTVTMDIENGNGERSEIIRKNFIVPSKSIMKIEKVKGEDSTVYRLICNIGDDNDNYIYRWSFDGLKWSETNTSQVEHDFLAYGEYVVACRRLDPNNEKPAILMERRLQVVPEINVSVSEISGTYPMGVTFSLGDLNLPLVEGIKWDPSGYSDLDILTLEHNATYRYTYQQEGFYMPAAYIYLIVSSNIRNFLSE